MRISNKRYLSILKLNKNKSKNKKMLIHLPCIDLRKNNVKIKRRTEKHGEIINVSKGDPFIF